MSEEWVERLLRERGRGLDGPLLPEAAEAALRQRIAAEAQEEARRAAAPAFAGPGTRLAWAAAAAVLLALGAFVLDLDGGPPRLEGEVAVLESTATIAGYRALHELDPSRLPGTDRSSSPDSPPVDEIVSYAAETEQRLAAAALAEEARELDADWFRIAFRPAQACSAVVLRIAPDASVTRLYPEESGPDVAENRFEAHRVHFLPRPSVARGDSPGGPVHDYDPGFVRPRSMDRVVVVLGLRREPLKGLDLALPAWEPAEGRAETRVAEVRAWLEERGFSVSEVTVGRP